MRDKTKRRDKRDQGGKRRDKTKRNQSQPRDKTSWASGGATNT